MVAVGHDERLTSESDAGGAVGEPSGTGGTAQSPLFSADHETADFNQWLSGDAGIKYVEGSGQLALSSERAHGGEYSFVATLAADDGELHQAVLGRNVKLRYGRYGAWYFLPSAPTTDGWVIMKLSNGSSRDRFDIDLVAPDGEAPRLRLWERPDGWISESAALTFPVGQWVHVEALYRSTPDADGQLVILQDGELALDTGPRWTADDDRVTFYAGSISRHLSPSPYRLFIDDATINAE